MKVVSTLDYAGMNFRALWHTVLNAFVEVPQSAFLLVGGFVFCILLYNLFKR